VSRERTIRGPTPTQALKNERMREARHEKRHRLGVRTKYQKGCDHPSPFTYANGKGGELHLWFELLGVNQQGLNCEKARIMWFSRSSFLNQTASRMRLPFGVLVECSSRRGGVHSVCCAHAGHANISIVFLFSDVLPGKRGSKLGFRMVLIVSSQFDREQKYYGGDVRMSKKCKQNTW
jgi:hypothetical protein